MTFGDTFVAICACFVIATAIVPLMHKISGPPPPAADAH